MIEILKNDPLLKEINKTGKKITVKHYLNEKLGPTYFSLVIPGESYDDDDYPTETDYDNPCYTLYVRVIFNRQSVKMRSATYKRFSVNGLDNLNSENKLLLRREALCIAQYVSMVYNRFDPHNYQTMEQQAFDLYDEFNDYDYNKLSVVNVLENFLSKEIQKELRLISDRSSNMLYLMSGTSECHPYQLLKFLQQHNESWIDFENRYCHLIWFFALYHKKFACDSPYEYNLGATLIDAKFLSYAQEIKSFYKNENLDEQIDKAIDLLSNITESNSY
jgi:hypothetical protein